MMYGPQGFWWDEVDENDNPLLHQAESLYTAEEKYTIGSWFWNFCSHSDLTGGVGGSGDDECC